MIISFLFPLFQFYYYDDDDIKLTVQQNFFARIPPHSHNNIIIMIVNEKASDKADITLFRERQNQWKMIQDKKDQLL